jgi:UDP-galactopyranose mutase
METSRMTKRYDYVVVGAGLTGIVVAQQISEILAASVLLVESQQVVGGLCRTERHPGTGVLFNPLGTRVFYTDDEAVWAYLTKFGSFTRYEHRLLARMQGEDWPVPVNLDTIRRFYGLPKLSSDDARIILERDARIGLPAPPGSLEELAVQTLGRPLYKAFVHDFITKQLGVRPSELTPGAFATTFPIRFDHEDRYAPTSRWQGLPLSGYSALFDRMLGSRRIRIELGVDFHSNRDIITPRKALVFTGAVDAYFENSEGAMERGCNMLEWKVETTDITSPVLTFPDAPSPYFRAHVPARLPINEIPPSLSRTLVGYEFGHRHAPPSAHSYSFVRSSFSNQNLFKAYRSLATREARTFFLGRQSSPSFNMARSIHAALTLVRGIVKHGPARAKRCQDFEGLVY